MARIYSTQVPKQRLTFPLERGIRTSMVAFQGSRIQAVAFDYGNTLIEFGRNQIDHCDEALGEVLAGLYGQHDPERYRTLREADRLAPYRNGYREGSLPELTRQMVVSLYGRPPSPSDVDELVAARFRAFVEVIQVETTTLEVLDWLLSAGLRLGLLSNYPCGDSIRASLERTDILRRMSTVVVSGEVGFVKPHAAVYRTLLEQLGTRAHETLYVGDNWLADVQGAKSAGLPCVQMRRWIPPEHFQPSPDDHQPDGTIDHLERLPDLLTLP